MLWTMLGLLIRSALVLCFASLLCREMRRRGPAYRHRILLTGFVALLAWPVFIWLVPEIYVPLAWNQPGRPLVTVWETATTQPAATRLADTTLLAGGIWLLGVLLGMVSLLIGQFRIFSLKRHGVPMQADGPLIQEAADRTGLTRTPRILQFGQPLMPQTAGVLHPCLLLPHDWNLWSEARKRAVLLHEFSHIRRRDTAGQLAVNLATVFWWFQPLCWIVRRRVRAESEQACDAMVVASGVQPSTYAAELLAIAHAFRARPQPLANALRMAEEGSLHLRLQSILNTPSQATGWSAPPKGAGWRSAYGAIVALLIWTAGCSAISIADRGHLLSKGGVSMRRTLFATMSAGLLTSAGLSAAAIGGSVLDPSGAAVLNAKASLYNPDTKDRQEVLSMADGKFQFDNLKAGQYILRVEKPGFAPILRAFAVNENATVDRGLTLQSENAGVELANTKDSVAGVSGSKVIRVGGQVAQSNLVEKINPVYPAAAKAAGLQGTVMLEAAISAEGVPEEIRVVSSPSDDLSQSALEAVRQWRYRPVLLNGNPVEVSTTIMVNYTLAP